MKKLYYINIVIFLASFLLFQIELIISKIFLPKFGGSYLVWGACVVFFQSILLIGYLYSHFVTKKFRIGAYRYPHLVLLLLPLLFFPGRALPEVTLHQNIAMVLDIFWQLLFSIGLVFFVLSTTSIIFQSWLAESELSEKTNPYRLYAVSNLGSFLALLSYPFFFEAKFNLTTQLNIWRFGYCFLLICHVIVFNTVRVIQDKSELNSSSLEGPGGKDIIRWFSLGAAGIIAFLSVTNIITYEITPAPLLWIIPLCVYLLSFVFNFKAHPFCPGWIKNNFHLVTAFGLVLFFLTQKRFFPFIIEIIAYTVFLFLACMFCQNELALSKPKDTKGLTLFYLTIASGSFFGGVVVTWIAPLIFTLPIEYLFCFLTIYLAMVFGDRNPRVTLADIRFISYALFIIILWPTVFTRYNIFGLIILFLLMKTIYARFQGKRLVLCLSVLSVIILAPSVNFLWSADEYIYTKRNYYGIYKIYETKNIRFLMNGTTLHGAQYISGKNKQEPLTYYHHQAPVGKFIDSNIFELRNIGVVGLGVGTLASYGRKGQTMDFFELDPEVFYIADNYFEYLKQSSAKINYVFGDARIMIQKMPGRHYDLLVIDAFSGDSVPIHLLTTEAIREYKKHIKDDGVILFHVSNRYLNLVPVLFSNAKLTGAYPSFNYNHDLPKGKKEEFLRSVWVAFTWDGRAQKKLLSELKWKEEVQDAGSGYFKPWTDQYSNILAVFKLQQFLDGLREFRPFYW
jgi:spermidine synthase